MRGLVYVGKSSRGFGVTLEWTGHASKTVVLSSLTHSQPSNPALERDYCAPFPLLDVVNPASSESSCLSHASV